MHKLHCGGCVCCSKNRSVGTRREKSCEMAQILKQTTIRQRRHERRSAFVANYWRSFCSRIYAYALPIWNWCAVANLWLLPEKIALNDPMKSCLVGKTASFNDRHSVREYWSLCPVWSCCCDLRTGWWIHTLNLCRSAVAFILLASILVLTRFSSPWTRSHSPARGLYELHIDTYVCQERDEKISLVNYEDWLIGWWDFQ